MEVNRLKTRRSRPLAGNWFYKRIIVVFVLVGFHPSFTLGSNLQRRGCQTAKVPREAVEAEVVESFQNEKLDYVLPVGPACPFRSDTMVRGNFEKEMAMAHYTAASKSGEFDALVRQIAAGIPPDPRQQRKVGFDLKQQGDRLKQLLDAMEESQDFQVIEAYHIMEQKALKMGAPSIRTVEKMTSWQGAGIMAEADGMMVPPPPQGVDPVALAKQAPSGRSALQSQPNAPRVLPFEETSFESSEDAKQLGVEYLKLSKEHSDMVNFGAKYKDFDQAGKEFYVDRMLAITRQWQEVLSKARRLGLKPVDAYMAFSEEYLSQSGLSPTDFREMVNEVHHQLRQKADHLGQRS